MSKNNRIYLPLLVTAILCIQGCAGLIVGAGVGAASVAHDRRTMGTQIDDTTLASRISVAIAGNEAISHQANVTIQVFNGVALLVGQAPTQTLIQQTEKLAMSVKNIRKLHNQIRLGSPIPASVVASDTWLASKVKTQLIADKRIDGLHIEIEVENGEVFLMGLVSDKESRIAVDITRNIKGVKQVIKAFEYNTNHSI
ncbi:BON domain-containing protein [uncultured Paraglaciecola sp.]|uniref:BON domain-containing protein n=1 Tax=uncultured Paraglaciecola sp. TaxID=1765024 RepID=UPI00261CDA34|nr:BON domain-containing protein [uncultured Paraglaciecola sp.]